MGAKGSPVIVLCINNFQTQEKICFKDSTHVSIAKCTKTRAEKWKIESKFKKKRTNIHKNCVKFLETYFVGYKSRELPSSSWCLYSIRCTTMRVRRYFGSTITPRQPPGRRNGDVSEPSAWIPVDAVTNPQAPEEQMLVSIRYYHVPSDGLPLCKHCYRQLAQHFCTVCAVDYCVNCHRLTHASPFGVRQKANATQKELANADCTIRVTAGSHHSRHCKSCAKDLCRPCSRRLHGTDNKLKHDFSHV
mmetsp:Transcript_14713/g.21879  ORF Transcript_14713/g.21879 Transcript_14713/m.21879 type:complete len:247 (+) Transcript_14713:206-946(+)